MEIQHSGNKLIIEVETLPIVSFVTQQNGMKLIRTLFVVNPDREAVVDLDIEVRSTPAFTLPFSCHLDKISPNSRYEVKEVNVLLDGSYLIGITERITGTLQITIKKGGKSVCTEQKEISVLAYDEWPGVSNCPELISSFVTPNNPCIVPISARAASLMEYWTHDPSLTGYQRNDSNHVLKMAAAVYSAIKEKNLVYSMPLASFEISGQRVRMIDDVLDTKFGTCLDLSVLYASCLEAIGLNPIIVFFEGHACCGVWLTDNNMPECASDDVAVLTKRIAEGVNEIALIECTCLVAGNNATFEDAKSIAEKKILEGDSFDYVIDVHRCRIVGIKPIPSKSQIEKGVSIDRPEISVDSQAPADLREVSEVTQTAMTATTRKSNWEHKLLDLGLRNTLINLRFTRTIVPILCADINELEDGLSTGREYSIYGRPDEWKFTDGITVANHVLDSSQKSVILSELRSGRLRSLNLEGEIQGSLKDLFRNAKLSIEENGANTLYLALGMLRWCESAGSTDKPRFAPIILLPVDLMRRGGGEGFSLRLRDDDPQVNITILEKLKQDFNLIIEGLDPLPQDENGIDTRKVFTVIRRSIMTQKGWDVIETACIGLFSFTQFVMWHDLHERSDDLEKNKIVKSLIEGRLMWDAEPMVPEKNINEGEALLPIPTDASQLYAIKKAADGNSFVLQGPPGTGKSQAITAMIANALAMNKTVLFVAEKMAALEVVEKRLQKIGIGDFCLELHSNKAKKKNVLDQLKKTLERARINPSEYADKANKIAEMRHQLDCYANELHEIRPCKMSLYELINQYEENITAPDITNLDESIFADFEKISVGDLINQAERLSAAGKYIGSPKNHPLSMVGCTEYHQSIRSDLAGYADAYIASLKQLQEVTQKVGSMLNLKHESFEELEKFYKLSTVIELWKGIPRKWALQEKFPFFIEQIRMLAKAQIKLAERKDRWERTWKKESETLPAELLLNEYRTADSSWFLSKLLGINTLKKKITPFMYIKPATDDLELELAVLDSYQKAQKNADELLNLHAGKLDYEYRGEETDWNKILSLTTLALDKAEALRDITSSDGIRVELFSIPELFDISDVYKAAWSKMQEAKVPLYNLLKIKERGPSPNWLESEIHGTLEIVKHKDEIKEFIAWKEISQECRNIGMSSIVDAYTNGMDSTLVVPAFKKCLFRQLIEKIIDTSKTLSPFSGIQFNERIHQFKKMDDTLTKLTQREIYYRLSLNLPNITKEAAQSSELGILQRAIRSGGRGQSIRKLIEHIPTMLPRLCPCMLMSPISAAQYLDPHREPFDIVIFDEASQISTAKAVGVLARGKDAVIVGDPKQMPPTSFFATNTIDEDNFENEDLESILEDCLAINMPQTSLLWHYRSRHESLISFSNSEFYNNELYTFPSVNDRDAKVSFVKVDGIFERGKSRQNRKEAEAVLEEIIRRAHNDQLKNQSIGVVTFNIVQQNLIDDLLSEAVAIDPVLFSWAYESEEPIFIKNLENVQGDERDVVLFSIGYGPDNNGKISMNFGPLNREGGWRRLNVAVTRAREEMKVFSSMEPEDIDLSRTSAEGVKALKGFLQYAKDHMVIESADTIYDVPETNGIVESICEALYAKGYETDVFVGHSEYRIDIGIVDRNNPDKYILGILLDGKNYKESKTTRDREIAQISVLNGLGWNIHRVWSLDWWDNKNKELTGIFSELERLESDQDESIKDEPQMADDLDGADDDNPLEVINVERNTIVPPAYVTKSGIYMSLSPEEFCDVYHRNVLMSCANTILQTEAPISHGLLERRIVHNTGLSRAGARMKQSVQAAISQLSPFATTPGGIFYWNNREDVDSFNMVRMNGAGESSRNIEDISYYEIENAIVSVIAEQGAMETEDLLRQTAKVFGFLRVADNISRRITEALEFASKKGMLVIRNNRFGLSDKGEKKASLVLEWIKNNGTLQPLAVERSTVESRSKRVIQTILWDEYEDWSDSTKLSRFSHVEPLCDSKTLAGYLYTFDDEKNAMKLVEKAISRGMRFSLEDAVEVVSNVDGDLRPFISAIDFNSSKVDDFFEFMDYIDDTYYPDVIESAAKDSLRIDANWFIKNKCYFSEDIQELFIQKLLTFNSIHADVLFNSIGDIFDGKGAELVLSKAIDVGLQPRWEAVNNIIDGFAPNLKAKVMCCITDYSRCECSELADALWNVPKPMSGGIIIHASKNGLSIEDDFESLDHFLTAGQKAGFN